MIVGMIHIQCGSTGKCGGHVFAVPADAFVAESCELREHAILNKLMSWSGPKRYCPACEDIDINRGGVTDRERDIRLDERREHRNNISAIIAKHQEESQ